MSAPADAARPRSSRSPQGARTRLEAAGYAAEIAEVGASLALLEDAHGPLVVPVPEEIVRPGLAGAVLAPWSNRIRDGRYSFGGVEHRLPLNEPERGAAAHGLVCWDRWDLAAHDAGGPDAKAAHAEFRLEPAARPGYPFQLRLTARYALDRHGLSVEVVAENIGTGRAPYAAACHPYLVAPTGTMDDWTLTVPASAFLEVDSERLLPRSIRPVKGLDEDFRAGRGLREEAHDVALGGLDGAENGWGEARLTDAAGAGVSLRFDAAVSWIQVFTEGPGEGLESRAGVAVEPMTAPADAFNSGQDLVVLEPGERHTMRWVLGRI